jgi:hypothetical protein
LIEARIGELSSSRAKGHLALVDDTMASRNAKHVVARGDLVIPRRSLRQPRIGGQAEVLPLAAASVSVRAMTSGPVVVLGMTSYAPSAGLSWQTAQYLEGFRRLGYDVYYVEDHGYWPFNPLSQCTRTTAPRRCASSAT